MKQTSDFYIYTITSQIYIKLLLLLTLCMLGNIAWYLSSADFFKKKKNFFKKFFQKYHQPV